MSARLKSLAFAVLSLSLSAGALVADPPTAKKAKKPLPVKYPVLAIGAEAPDFRLPGVDGRTYSLKDFADAKVLIVIFTCNHCPTAQAYEGRIKAMHADYRDKGVALVAISPNDPKAVRLDEMSYTDVGDSLEDMKVRAKNAGFAFPYLYDGDTQETSRAYGVIATPQVYIFDKARKLRYVGRFDDSDVKVVTSHDAVNALEDLLAGRSVAVETTRVFGCSTKWAEKGEDSKASLAKWEAEPVALKTINDEEVAPLVRNDTKKLLLVNLWATGHGPSVADLPELVTMNRMYRKRNFELVTISLDDPGKRDEALKVLRELHVSSTNYILQSNDRSTFAKALDKDDPGRVPSTLLIAPGGKVIYRKVGAIDPLDLKRAVVDYNGRTYGTNR